MVYIEFCLRRRWRLIGGGGLHVLGAIHLSGEHIYGLYIVTSQVDCMY